MHCFNGSITELPQCIFQNECQNIFRIHLNRSWILLPRWHVISSWTLSGQFLKKRFFQDWMVWSQKNLNKKISTNQMKNLGKLKMTTGKPNHLKVYLLLKLVTFDCHASFRGEYINLKNINIQTLRVKDHNAKNNEFQILEPNWSLPRRRCHSKMTRNKPPQPPQRNSFVKTKQRASRYLQPSEKKCLENHTN